MLDKKNGKPMALRCSFELREETEKTADSIRESLSNYIRKAIEERNLQYRGRGIAESGTIEIHRHADNNLNTNELSIEPLCEMLDKCKENLKGGKKETHETMVRTFQKGGK